MAIWMRKETKFCLNYRRGKQPFRIVSLADIEQGNFQPEWIEKRIVLIGITAISVRDDASTNAVRSDNAGFILWRRISRSCCQSNC